jgi:hypothetical protein
MIVAAVQSVVAVVSSMLLHELLMAALEALNDVREFVFLWQNCCAEVKCACM